MRVVQLRPSSSARVGLALTLAILLLAAGPLAPGAKAGFYCPPVEQLYAAGSGGGQEPNLALRNELQRDLGDDLFWSRFVNYPAVSVFGGLSTINGFGSFIRAGDVGSYHDSVVRGKNELRRLVNQLISKCGKRTRIVLSGYSQGAQATADVYQELERSNRAGYVFAVVLFGDPYFNGDAAGRGASTGNLRNGDGIDGSLGRRPGYADFPKRVRSYCHRKDPICQANRSAAAWMGPRAWVASVLGSLAAGSLSLSAHKYHLNGEPQDAGRWISTRVHAELPKPVQPPPPSSPPDDVQPPDPGTSSGGDQGGTGTPETAGGVAHTWTDHLHAGGTQGPSIQPGQTVLIACKIPGFKVANGNTWWYRIASNPWSSQFYVSADAFYNNGATSGSLAGTPFVDPAVPDCGGSQQPTPDPGGVSETTGGVTHTWTNYSNAGGTQGPSIQAFQTVTIACKVQGFKVADGNTWWYRIASGPWNGAYYASADAFYNNGATSGSLIGTPWVDPGVPDCAAPPPPPPPPPATWAETVGGVTHTWTNYTNAGGTQGPSIQTGQTVQIACKLQGFRVADGNTWWYRIASSPWNGAYYASADAFYNNGATSGSLIGTPFVDNAVANC